MVLRPGVAVGGLEERPDQLFPFGVGDVSSDGERRCEPDFGFAFHCFRNRTYVSQESSLISGFRRFHRHYHDPDRCDLLSKAAEPCPSVDKFYIC